MTTTATLTVGTMTVAPERPVTAPDGFPRIDPPDPQPEPDPLPDRPPMPTPPTEPFPQF